MVTYSINEIEKLSGIKAHTLRIWEKRYAIVQPRRTDKNIRYYLDEDLKRIMDIALLNKQGYKISKIACMCDKELGAEIAKYTCVESGGDDTLDSLIMATTSLDEYMFNCILDHHFKQIGLEKSMDEVVYPLLDKIVLMSTARTINSIQEEFAISAVRRKLICAINSVFHFAPVDAPRIVLYINDDSVYELYMLHLQYILCQEGIHVLNLGMIKSIDNVTEACRIFNADMVYPSFSSSTSPDIIEFHVKRLRSDLKSIMILLSDDFSSKVHVPTCNLISKVKGVNAIKEFAVKHNKN